MRKNFIFALAGVGSMLIWAIKLGDWVPFVIGSSIVLFVFIVQSVFMDDINLKDKNEKMQKMQIAILIDFNKQYGFWIFASVLCICFYLLFKFYHNADSR